MRKEGRAHINDLSFHLKKTEKRRANSVPMKHNKENNIKSEKAMNRKIIEK